MFSFAPGIGGLSRREGGSVASPGSQRQASEVWRRLWGSLTRVRGAGRRHWKGTTQVSLESLPPTPKLHLAIGKACICVATRAWDIPPCVEDCIVMLCSLVDVSVELYEPDGSIEAARRYCGELGAADHSESTALTIVVHCGCAQRTVEPRTRVMERH